MKKKRHKAEEIIAKLREIEKMQAGGKTIEEACKDLGIADQTYYRRRKLYGKMPVDELKRLKELVSFERFRRGQREKVRFGRLLYDEETLEQADERDEADIPRHSEHYGKLWPSRHFAYVQLLTNNGGSDLLTIGKAGVARNGEDLWHFTDSADLMRRLKNETLPLILSVGMSKFDEQLENELDLIERGVSTGYRPPDAA